MNLKDAAKFIQTRWHEISRDHQEKILDEFCWMLDSEAKVSPDEWKEHWMRTLLLIKRAKEYVDLEV